MESPARHTRTYMITTEVAFVVALYIVMAITSLYITSSYSYSTVKNSTISEGLLLELPVLIPGGNFSQYHPSTQKYLVCTIGTGL